MLLFWICFICVHHLPPPLPTHIVVLLPYSLMVIHFGLVKAPLRGTHWLYTLMYVISVVPLIRQLSGLAHQVWYADDAAAGGSNLQLWEWWSCLSSAGCHVGYFTNAKKTWLVVKQEPGYFCRYRHTNYFNWSSILGCCFWLRFTKLTLCVN